jgi:hypothetical protein
MRPLILMLTVAGSMLIVGCRSAEPSNSFNRNREAPSAPKCTAPENPFDEGSGHYAGYEWAESSGSGTCDGHSQSFIEGCEEYESQEAKYQDCEAKKHN